MGGGGACTTHKVPASNRVVSDRWATHCQKIHLKNLLTAKAEVSAGPSAPSDAKWAARKAERVKQLHSQKRALFVRERQRRIKLENQVLLKKLIEIDRCADQKLHDKSAKKKQRLRAARRKAKAAQAAGNAVEHQVALEIAEQASMATNMHRAHANKVVTRVTRMKREQRRIETENLRLMKRIISARPTISSKELEREARRRDRLVQSLSDYSQHKVLDMSHLTLQAVRPKRAPVDKGSRTQHYRPQPPAASGPGSSSHYTGTASRHGAAPPTHRKVWVPGDLETDSLGASFNLRHLTSVDEDRPEHRTASGIDSLRINSSRSELSSDNAPILSPGNEDIDASNPHVGFPKSPNNQEASLYRNEEHMRLAQEKLKEEEEEAAAAVAAEKKRLAQEQEQRKEEEERKRAAAAAEEEERLAREQEEEEERKRAAAAEEEERLAREQKEEEERKRAAAAEEEERLAREQKEEEERKRIAAEEEKRLAREEEEAAEEERKRIAAEEEEKRLVQEKENEEKKRLGEVEQMRLAEEEQKMLAEDTMQHAILDQDLKEEVAQDMLKERGGQGDLSSSSKDSERTETASTEIRVDAGHIVFAAADPRDSQTSEGKDVSAEHSETKRQTSPEKGTEVDAKNSSMSSDGHAKAQQDKDAEEKARRERRRKRKEEKLRRLEEQERKQQQQQQQQRHAGGSRESDRRHHSHRPASPNQRAPRHHRHHHQQQQQQTKQQQQQQQQQQRSHRSHHPHSRSHHDPHQQQQEYLQQQQQHRHRTAGHHYHQQQQQSQHVHRNHDAGHAQQRAHSQYQHRAFPK